MTIKPENKSTQSVVEIEEGSTPPTTPEAAVLAKTSIKASIRIPSLAIITYGLVLAPVFSQILCPLPIYTRDEPRTVPLRPTNTLDDSLMTAQVSRCLVQSHEDGPPPNVSNDVYEFFCSAETGGFHISRTNWQVVMMLFTVFRVAYPFLVVMSDSQLAKKIGSIISDDYLD